MQNILKNRIGQVLKINETEKTKQKRVKEQLKKTRAKAIRLIRTGKQREQYLEEQQGEIRADVQHAIDLFIHTKLLRSREKYIPAVGKSLLLLHLDTLQFRHRKIQPRNGAASVDTDNLEVAVTVLASPDKKEEGKMFVWGTCYTSGCQIVKIVNDHALAKNLFDIYATVEKTEPATSTERARQAARNETRTPIFPTYKVLYIPEKNVDTLLIEMGGKKRIELSSSDKAIIASAGTPLPTKLDNIPKLTTSIIRGLSSSPEEEQTIREEIAARNSGMTPEIRDRIDRIADEAVREELFDDETEAEQAFANPVLATSWPDLGAALGSLQEVAREISVPIFTAQQTTPINSEQPTDDFLFDSDFGGGFRDSRDGD